MTIRTGFMRVLPALALATATLIGGAGPAGAQSAASQRSLAPAAPPAALSVTPNTGLVDNQPVTLGAISGADTYLLCPTTLAASPQRCAYLADSNPGGSSVTANIPARIVVNHDDGTFSFTDCRTTSCTVEAVSYDMSGDNGPVVLAASTVAFNPAGALRTPPVLTATPHAGLVDDQNVDVTVNPATASDALDGTIVLQCITPMTTLDDLQMIFTNCSFDTVTELSGPAGGTATGKIKVRAFVNTPTGPVDCRATTATCVLFTYDQVFQMSNVSLAFDENGPLKPAFLARPKADPSDYSADTTYDLVGFTPSDPFTVSWCNPQGVCLSPVVTSGTLDVKGMATFTIAGKVLYSDAPQGDTICLEGCALTATDAHGLTATSNDQVETWSSVEPGPFHSKQLPVQVTPHKGLHDGDTVTVTGSGFTPGSSVAIIECNGSAATIGLEACDINTSTFLGGTEITADAQGNATATYAIKQHISTPDDGPLDCATSNVDPDAYLAGVAADPSRGPITAPGYFSCMIVMADISDYEFSGGSPISFAGATFRRLPWQTDQPEASPQAVPAKAVFAQPTFTG